MLKSCMTYDAKFVYEDIAKHTLGDWQSPAMTVLWRLIDPIAPGSGSMFASVLVREYRRQMIHRPRPGVRYVIVNR